MHTEKSIRVVVEKDQFPFKRVFYLGDDMEYTARMKNYGVEMLFLITKSTVVITCFRIYI